MVCDVPALRFPEFTEEWKRIKVSDLLDFYSTNSLSWEQLEYESNEPYNLHYGLIHVGLPTIIDLTKDKLPSIKDGNVPKKYELCKEGDIAFADASEDTNEVAKVVEFYNLDGKKVVCGLHTIHGRDNNKQTAKGFLGYCFSSTVFHYQIRRIAQGTKIYSINTRNFSEAFVGLPSKSEQHKIATLLKLIDERISTQNKIIEKLETLIKGIRNNIMSKIKGDCITLQDIADIYQPQTIASTDLTEDGYLVYGANGIIGKYHSFNHEKEQICITCRGNTCGTVNFTEPKSWITGNAMVINTDNYAKNVNKRYLFHYLSSINFNSIISRSGQPQIVRQPLAKLKLILPVLIIQNRIAECLDAMFAKMKNEQSFLQILQIQKSCLLSQMFI
ncbi:restriction endonuclease subunit S [Bacteroides eggerthii]|nr:restriction endonuclease subunit S [Bacteroides eggerthii]MBU8996960.1 restriction endonuclease subunit S [Bacteroides eggerthii]